MQHILGFISLFRCTLDPILQVLIVGILSQNLVGAPGILCKCGVNRLNSGAESLHNQNQHIQLTLLLLQSGNALFQLCQTCFQILQQRHNFLIQAGHLLIDIQNSCDVGLDGCYRLLGSDHTINCALQRIHCISGSLQCVLHRLQLCNSSLYLTHGNNDFIHCIHCSNGIVHILQGLSGQNAAQLIQALDQISQLGLGGNLCGNLHHIHHSTIGGMHSCQLFVCSTNGRAAHAHTNRVQCSFQLGQVFRTVHLLRCASCQQLLLNLCIAVVEALQGGVDLRHSACLHICKCGLQGIQILHGIDGRRSASLVQLL